MNGVLNGHLAVPPTPPVVTRKRKRPHQYTVSYSKVQEVDSEGKLREVIVIDDTPPPPTISPLTTYNGFSASYQPPTYSAPIRTRARTATEAQALSASSSSSTHSRPSCTTATQVPRIPQVAWDRPAWDQPTDEPAPAIAEKHEF
ncbi:hypothetical protein FIBSPDRAFT_991018 [Athelia psychrophila]|uniref:Uncharacterized protein n=1 Tax=Athelia psychrophila TaxID=1759441 RepID=A0A165ZBM7_9AGAM|nr:hypothetical protein FIBSPDRAFT_991018 [Fibularhizoctonia sp. CBS 109695]